MSNRDDPYYTTRRARTPAAEQSTLFSQGQGGRTLLPPISSAFPTSSSPVPSHSNPSSQPVEPRSSPNRFECNQVSYSTQRQPNTRELETLGHTYSAHASPMCAPAAPRPSTVAPGQHSPSESTLTLRQNSPTIGRSCGSFISILRSPALGGHGDGPSHVSGPPTSLGLFPDFARSSFEHYNDKPTSSVLSRSKSQPSASTSSEQTENWNQTNQTKKRVAAAVTRVLGTSLLVTHEALHLTSEILAVVPVPGLQVAAKVLLDIWDSVQAIDSNRLACLRLTERCADILLSIREEIGQTGEELGDELTTSIEKLVSSFTEVYHFMANQAHLPFLKRYFKRDQILRDIANCDKALGEALSMFGISIQIRILKQVQAVELSRQSETRALYECVVRSQQPAAPVPSATLQGLGISLPTSTTSLPPSSFAVRPQEDIHPNAVLPTLQNLHNMQNTLALTHDTADLRTLMREAVSQSSDAEMIRVLQVGRDEMPEALETLQRALERVGVVNNPPNPYAPVAEAPVAASASSTLAPQSLESVRQARGAALPVGLPVRDKLDGEFMERGSM